MNLFSMSSIEVYMAQDGECSQGLEKLPKILKSSSLDHLHQTQPIPLCSWFGFWYGIISFTFAKPLDSNFDMAWYLLKPLQIPLWDLLCGHEESTETPQNPLLDSNFDMAWYLLKQLQIPLWDLLCGHEES
eukprot:Gb_33672 [translate_table: standard]